VLRVQAHGAPIHIPLRGIRCHRELFREITAAGEVLPRAIQAAHSAVTRLCRVEARSIWAEASEVEAESAAAVFGAEALEVGDSMEAALLVVGDTLGDLVAVVHVVAVDTDNAWFEPIICPLIDRRPGAESLRMSNTICQRLQENVTPADNRMSVFIGLSFRVTHLTTPGESIFLRDHQFRDGLLLGTPRTRRVRSL